MGSGKSSSVNVVLTLVAALYCLLCNAIFIITQLSNVMIIT